MTISRWERWTNWPLTIASLAFLVAYALPIIRLDLPVSVVRVAQLVTGATWALFALDLGVPLALASRRGHYLLKYWLDVLIIALPLLRPLRYAGPDQNC
jgi:voltage-gated potassium channel